MLIGNKILELRKQNGITQEVLAEKMGVARQTISKWELGETSPDLEQSRKLSQIFKISLDDLVCNDVGNVIIEKVSNIEKFSKIIINILKIILLIVVIVVIMLTAMICFKDYFSVTPSGFAISFKCFIDDKEFVYEVWSKFDNPNGLEFYTNDVDLNLDITRYNKFDWVIEDVKTSVVSRGGICD